MMLVIKPNNRQPKGMPMNVKRPWNTKERGSAESIIFRQGNTWFGVCLTFDIVEEGRDYDEVYKALTTAIKLHIQTVQKENLPDALLNRYAPIEYWEMYFTEMERRQKKHLSEDINDSSTYSLPYQALAII